MVSGNLLLSLILSFRPPFAIVAARKPEISLSRLDVKLWEIEMGFFKTHLQ